MSDAQHPYAYYERTKSKDPNAPTAIFLDAFGDRTVEIAPGDFVSHGEISRMGAEHSGYSTVALNFNYPMLTRKGFLDLSPALKKIDADIHSGKLEVGKGDVLSISLVNSGTTFEQLSKAVGRTITPDNLADNKDYILNVMKKAEKDKHLTKLDHDVARTIVETSKAIKQLQADGLTVVHSAGNDGPDTVQVAFLDADVQLSSNKPDGTPDSFSVSNSLTTKSDGVFPMVYHPGPDLLDPTPLANQKGTLEIVGTGVEFPNKSKTAFIDNTKFFDRQSFDYQMPLLDTLPPPVVLTAEELLPKLTVSGEAPMSSWTAMPSVPQSAAKGPVKIETLRTRPLTLTGRPLAEIQDELVEGTVQGTSFANIPYLRGQFAQLRQEKIDAAAKRR